MGFGQAITSVIRNAVNFSGRACRSEFWWWALLTNVVTGTAYVADLKLHTGLLVTLSILVIFVPNLAVEVRRLHDMDATGWWVLLSFIPLLGALILMLWFTSAGTYGENRYGPDPLEEEPQAVRTGAALT
jgi:uncharacterized membrane protein YhaH (DUF805 family)